MIHIAPEFIWWFERDFLDTCLIILDGYNESWLINLAERGALLERELPPAGIFPDLCGPSSF